MINECFRIDDDVVNIGECKFEFISTEDGINCPLKVTRGVLQSERDSLIPVHPRICHKSSIFPRCEGKKKLMVPFIGIDQGEIDGSKKSVENLVLLGNGVFV